jgi:hypothetical protein
MNMASDAVLIKTTFRLTDFEEGLECDQRTGGRFALSLITGAGAGGKDHSAG